MADFTYNDYLLHKVVQPFSLRGQNFETSSLKKNIPLYLTRQAGKVREKLGNLDSKQLITKQAVQLPHKFLELEQQFDQPEIKRRGIDTNIGLKRERILPDEGEIDGKDDEILRSIKNRIAMEKYEDDFFVLTEAAKQTNAKKAEKLSVGKQIKTVLQEKVNEDQLKKLYRKYILETMKKNISLEKKTQMFSKQHEIHGGSLQFIEKRAFQGGSSTDIQKMNNHNSNSNGSSQGNTNNVNQKLRKEETLSEFALIEENEIQDKKESQKQIQPSGVEQLKHDKTKLSHNNSGRMVVVTKTNSMMIPSVRQLSAEISSSDDEDKDEDGNEGGISKSSKQNLLRLKEINKKQQQYKQNNKISDKNHIKNICQYFDLSIQKLFKLEDKIKGTEEKEQKKLADISLNSEDSQPEQDLFNSSLDDDENNNGDDNNNSSSSVDSSFRRPKKIKNTNNNQQENLSGQSSPNNQFNSNKLKGEITGNNFKPLMQVINKREDDILYDRIRYENEENLVNEQDEQIIRKVINLENQQELYSRYVQKKKKKLELEYLIGLKEGKGSRNNNSHTLNENIVNNNNNKQWGNNSMQGGGKIQLQEIQEQSQQENAGQESKLFTGLGKTLGQIYKSSNNNKLNPSSSKFIQIFQNGQQPQQDQKLSNTNSQRQVKLQKQPSNLSQKLLHQSSLSSQQSPQFSIQNTQDKSQQQQQYNKTSQSFYMGKTIESSRNIKSVKQNNDQSKSQFETSSSSQMLPQVDNNNNNLLARRSYNSYRLQDGKPIHEQSVLAFLKSDYKLAESMNNKMINSPKQTINTQQSSCYTEHPQRRLSKSRLDYLSTPKYGIDFENSSTSSQQVNGMLQRRSNTNNNISKQKFFISATQSPSADKNPQLFSNFCTARKENKDQVNKMKSEFLKFFDSCFEKKHEFQEEKHALRMEISDWYCNSQADLNRLFTNTGPQLSTLSPEFKAFIEQKNFQKKLFNYLINSMEPKDRQMAIYMYKQDRQLDDL